MPVMSPQQVSLGGGVNAYAAPHVLGDNEVATATNIDFGLQPGAAQVRFGARKLYSVGASPVRNLFIHYKYPLQNSVLYTQAGGAVYRGTGFTSILSGANTDVTAFTQFDGFMYTIGSAGTNCIKDDGTTATDWVKQAPPNAPTIFTTNTASALVVASTFTNGEGDMVGQSGGTATFTVTAAPYRIEIDAAPMANTNLDVDGSLGTASIGNYGIHNLSISFDEPGNVSRISQDYSIGGTTFADYWHTDLDLNFSTDLIPDAVKLLDAELTQGTNTNTALSVEDRQDIISQLKDNVTNNTTRMSFAADTFNTWTVTRPTYELVSIGTGGWTNIPRARIVIEANGPVLVKVKNWKIYGDSSHPLNDTSLGYMWWETNATITNGVVVGESAPGPPLSPTKLSNSSVTLLPGSYPTGNHGCTHRITYRSGGLLPQPYAVCTNTIGATSYTDNLSDIKALMNQTKLNIGAISKANFYNSVQVLSEPHYGHIFGMYDNQLIWSDVNVPDRFGGANYTQVSHAGDHGAGLVVWPPGLVIINRDSIYEMDGNIFEGPEANWILRRTGAKHGSKAPHTIVKTPYGIPLFELDGLYMYQPGQGVDTPIDFVMQQIGDMWKGTGGFDPAAVKGNRVPAMQGGYINNSCAEYYDNKYFLAVPTGTNTQPDTLFVIDFSTKRTWWYQYPFQITALCWDPFNGRLLAGTAGGSIMRLNLGYYDESDAGAQTGVAWKLRTKSWTTPNDAVLENIQVEAQGSGGSAVGMYDGTSTITIGTLTNTVKDWINPSLAGYVKNNIAFEFSGTQNANSPTALYQLKFDAMIEPPRVTFWRTEHDLNNSQGDKIWDVQYADIEPIGVGTVTGVIYVDNVVVGTNLIVSTGTQSDRTLRAIYSTTLPVETVGRVAYTEYTAPAGMQFKHWQTYYNTRPLPDLVTSFVSDKTCGDEAEWKTFEPCVGVPSGTITASSYIDGTLKATYGISGGNPYRQSYAFSMPNDTFGRSSYTVYTGTVPFRFYAEKYENIPEPDVMTNWKHGPVPFSSRSNLRTWVATVNPRGTMTGVLYADNVAISTKTFTGTDKAIYTEGLDVTAAMVLQTATILEAYYTGAGFKHWNTEYEVETKPFGKKTWSVSYKKVGGATQIDMARFWSWDVEAEGTATFTSIWDVDGTATHTQTFTCTGREWRDRIPFPPGVRGQLFQTRVLSNIPIHVYKQNLDAERIGVKGFSRVTYVGKPEEAN